MSINRNKNKILAWVLSLVLVLTMIPYTVFADSESVLSEGVCGDNLNWTLTTDGTLTISGTGDMTSHPWSDYKEQIKKLVVEEGVTSICDYAFSECEFLKGELIIPESVTKIGERAFFSCSGLTGDINIPVGVETLGLSAFRNCTGFTGDVSIPSTLRVIPNDTFKGCENLTGIKISEGVEVIGAYAFAGCERLCGELILPESIKELNSDIFEGCYNITDVYVYSSDCTIYNSMYTLPKEATVHGYIGSRAQAYAKNQYRKFKCIDHSWDSDCTVDKEATCTEEGSKSIHCTVCDEKKDVTVIEKAAHEYSGWVIDKNPTCTETGSKHKNCSVCGDKVTEEIKAAGHNWQEEYTVDKEATCTEEGLKSIHCSNCNATKDSESIDKIAHTLEKHTAKDVSCEEDGCIEHWKCTKCNKLFKDDKGTTEISTDEAVIAANGHEWNDGENVSGLLACQSGAWKFTCQNCGDVDYFEVKGKPHDYSIVKTIEPKCTEQGYTLHTCSICEASSYSDNFVDAKGHSLGEWETISEPTLVTTGLKIQKCTECGEIVNSITLPKYNDTCHAGGSIGIAVSSAYNQDYVFSCDGADISYTLTGVSITTGTGVTQPYKKTYSVKINNPGSWSLQIAGTVSGELIYNVYVTDHMYNDTWTVDKAATCKADGSKSHHCTICDNRSSITEIPATGHNWSEDYIIDKEATCTADGLKSIHCTYCDETKDNKTIEATGHDWDSDYTVDREPTCSREGSKSIHCKNCDETKNITAIQELPHEYGEWITDQEGTCTEPNITHKKCSVCSTIIRVTIPAIGHIWQSDYTIDKKSTATSKGSKSIHCAICSETKDTTEIAYPKTVKLSTAAYTYNGKVKTPSVRVYDSNGKLIDSSNYTATYASGRKNVGQYKVTVTFKSTSKEYSGSRYTTFKINPKGTSISSLTKGSKSFTAKWKKQSSKMASSRITGYQLRYSTSSKMTSAKNVTVKGYSSTSKKISKLKAKKKYYVQVRTYKTVSGTKYYSSWSKAKSVKTK